MSGLTLLLAWASLATLTSLTLSLSLTPRLLKSPRRAPPSGGPLPELTVIRPIKGLDPEAAPCHVSLFEGSYSPTEVLFVAESLDDPGLEAARQVCEAYPDQGALVAARPQPHVLSGKIINLLSGLERAQSELVAFTDSDIHLEPHHLEACLRALEDDSVGLVSLPTLYHADSAFGQFTMLVMTLDNALIGRVMARVGASGAAVGALVVTRRSTLAQIGGLEALGDALADDIRLGQLVDRAGQRSVFLDDLIIHNTRSEPPLSHLLRQHRWVTSVRTELPVFYWIQLLLLTPTSLWLLCCVVTSSLGSELSAWAWLGLALTASLRMYIGLNSYRRFIKPHQVELGARAWMLPLAELYYSLVSLITLLVPLVYWRGRIFLTNPITGRIKQQLN